MLERVSWLILAIAIHLPPFIAFFMPKLLTQLYAVAPEDANFPLLHHRAALFGVITIACLWAAFDPDVRQLVSAITAVSMISFLIIFFAYDQPQSLKTIALVDGIGIPFLAYVSWTAYAA